MRHQRKGHGQAENLEERAAEKIGSKNASEAAQRADLRKAASVLPGSKPG